MADDESDPGGEPPLPLDPDIWDKTPDQAKKLILAARYELIQSPLLPPELLQRYDNVVPGLPEKLVAWTEDEARHRREMEREAFEEARTLRSFGQRAGLATALIGLTISGVVGVYAAIYGSAAGAAVASVVAIVSVGGPFAARVLAGRWARQEDPKGDGHN